MSVDRLALAGQIGHYTGLLVEASARDTTDIDARDTFYTLLELTMTMHVEYQRLKEAPRA